MANYITFTCSADMVFPVYLNDGPKSMSATARREIKILGKANVTDKYSLAVPTGMITEVSDEDLAILQANDGFRRMVEKGFLKVSSSNALDKNLSGMTARDGSSQILDADHAASSSTMAYYGRGDRATVSGQKPVGFFD